MERIPISRNGYERLRRELHQLERHDRHDVIRAIGTAREHGDLSENAEYHAAKERQGHVEGRIRELQDKLGRAEVIDCTQVDCGRVVFGTVVTLLDVDTDEEVTYQLLGQEEVDVKQGVISVFSPLGRAMLGRQVGDEVRATAPRGVREFEIVSIARASKD